MPPSDLPRHTVEEIVTRYQLEPELRDAFVEGATDARLLEFWFSRRGLRDAAAYEISTVEVPAAEVLRLGLPDNNRGRVIALAYMIERGLGQHARAVACVIDDDFDRLFELEDVKVVLPSLVRKTDYACLEMYLFRDDLFAKFFSLSCRVSRFDVHAFRAALVAELKWLFFLRAASVTLKLGLTSIPLGAKYASASASRLFVDREKYLNAVLLASGKGAFKQAVLQEMQRHAAAAVGDDRCFMHGHDFLDAVSWFSKKAVGAFRSVPNEAICIAFWSCCEPEFLDGEPLFDALRTWASLAGDTPLFGA